MSFTDQKPRIATEEDIKAPWSGGEQGKYFRCKLCRHHFQAGDYYRWIYMGKEGYMNIIVCRACDTPDVKEKWFKADMEWNKMREVGPFWWFIAQLEAEIDDRGIGELDENRRI